MRLNRFLVIGSLMLGFPADALSETYNQEDQGSKAKFSSDAAGSFARAATEMQDTTKAADARKYLGIANSKIAQNPNNDTYYLARAQIYRDLGEYQSSLADINRAISLKPSNRSYYEFRSAAWSLLKDYPASLRDANKAIAIGPESADLYIRRACLLQLLGRYDESLRAAERSIAMDSDSSESYVIRGTIKFYLKDYKGAQSDCQRAESMKTGITASTKELRELLEKVNL